MHSGKTISCLFLLLILLATLPFSAKSQGTKSQIKNYTTTRQAVIKAVKIQGENSISLDGKLNESIWQSAPAATGFIQRAPDDGQTATEKTEAYVLYTKDAIYVGIKAYDSAMDSVAATLFRKDGSAFSDWVYVTIDTYNDNRTAYSFGVNPRGVHKDILIYNDDSKSIRWDAVWEAETVVEENYWSVEIRIPLSQLRFNADSKTQNWGINFKRYIARKDESSFWAPTPQSASGLVSQFGDLAGIKKLEQPAQLEITPYISANLTREPGSDQNPFYNQNAGDVSIGADIQYGLTSNFTLTATVNPDFGQVEADPAQINLSAFETFFPEQRPFFLEGTDIFQFGRTQTTNRFGNPIIFYSRRIGRKSQGALAQAGIQSKYVNRPDRTTIAGAVKLTGKTKNGLSIGVLNAVTTREKATYIGQNVQTKKMNIEPPTNYMVGRVKKDFNDGNTMVGSFLTAVNRFMGVDYLKSNLLRSSYTAGVDFEHSWNNQKWTASGVLSGSLVNGSKNAILQTQLASSRYYNRVDAHYLSVDSTKTSLSGYAGEFSIGRFGGEHWRGSFTYNVSSPGYEVNDIGFENDTDYRGISYLLMYREQKPAGPFRFYTIYAFANQLWNFGGDLLYNAISLAGGLDLKNLWSVNFKTRYFFSSYSDDLLRGGPLAKNPSKYLLTATIESDPTKKVSFDFTHSRVNDASGGIEREYFMNIDYRPASYIQLSVKPGYSYQTETAQFVTKIKDPTAVQTYGRRYLFATLGQKIVSAEFRLDWTFSPELSLQTYIRPYITSGNFYGYKEFTQPKGYEFAIYGKERGTISQKDNRYTVDPDGTGPAQSFSFRDRDFNFKSIQANAVLRWQYRPGSTVFLVWQHKRAFTTPQNNLNLRRDIEQIFSVEPTNIFLVKFTYWFDF